MNSDGWREISTCPIAETAEDKRYILVWHVFQGVMVSNTLCARQNRFHTHWREMPDEWIVRTDKIPTERDADAQQCVIIVDRYGEVKTFGWHQVIASPSVLLWTPPPKPPDNYLELRRNAD